MKRQDLAHLLRAACRITGDPEVLVIGSQSILGSYDEDDLPPEATASIEADIAFLHDPDRAKADDVEGAIGEWSAFHDLQGFYAEGVHVDTTVLPTGWRSRLVTWDLGSSEPATPRFLDPHDLAIAKLIAHRTKDKAFVDALIGSGFLDVETLRRLLETTPSATPAEKRLVLEFLSRYPEARGAEETN